MRQLVAALVPLVASLVASSAAAQVTVVEEEQVEEEQVVERGYVQGQGRGIQYGAYLISPVYVSDIWRAGNDTQRLLVGGGAGVHGRIGWEFPSGFTLEVFGGFAANGVDTQGVPEVSNIFLRADAGVGGRYMFFNSTAFVPFVQLAVQGRWYWFDWSTSGEAIDGASGFALNGALGAQIELTPYFGIEAGVAVDYAFGHELFGEGLISIMPFAGATLYVYDENEG
jgi:hypothetical protein